MSLLHHLSTEELGRLFPITISEANPQWPAIYAAEKEVIETALPAEAIFRIRHIGSTAVPQLKAKPTIDILLEIQPTYPPRNLSEKMENMGYQTIKHPENPPPHLLLVKGYTPKGFRGQPVHVHVRYEGDWDEIHFRNYLRTHPEIADKYARLKEKLAIKHQYNREEYTYQKTAFVQKYTQIAKSRKAEC